MYAEPDTKQTQNVTSHFQGDDKMNVIHIYEKKMGFIKNL